MRLINFPRLFLLTIFWFMSLASAEAVAVNASSMSANVSATPDGKTATIITTNSTGRDTVTIAPSVSSTAVSYNSWSAFNVRSGGVDFDNRDVHARLIVNEVTGTQPSTIQGGIAVLGPRANFVLANPNGITVNGGSFVNTGSLALSTGKVSLLDFVPSPGFTQRDVVLDTGAGQIEIGSLGLAGAFNSLDLISKSLVVNGSVINTTTQPNSKLQIVTGGSKAQIDSSISPIDDKSAWIYYGKGAVENLPGTVAVDITSLGSLTAGSIHLILTDAGTGVRQTGQINATVGDFTITATGLLSFAGAQIKSLGNIVLNGSDLAAAPSADGSQRTSFTADGDVQFLVPSADLTAVKVNAGTTNHPGSMLLGLPPGLGNAIGSYVIRGIESGTGEYLGSTFNATNGIEVFAQAQPLMVEGSTLNAKYGVWIEAGDTSVRDHVSSAGDAISTVSSAQGLFQLQSVGDITVNGSKIAGAAGLAIRGNSVQMNGVEDAAGVLHKSELRSDSGQIEVQSHQGVRITGADLLASGPLAVTAKTDIEIASDTADPGQSTIASVSGGLLMSAGGDFRNVGAYLRGTKQFTVDSLFDWKDGKPTSTIHSDQAVRVSAVSGAITNQSINDKQLAVIFGSEDNVNLSAYDDITNRAGRIVSNKNLSLVSETGSIFNIIDKVTGTNNEQALQNENSSSAYWILSRSHTGWSRDFGYLAIPNQLAYLVGNGDVMLQAHDVVNRGGEIDANAGDLKISAKQSIDNEALRTGEASFHQTCLIFCRRSSSSTVTFSGGQMNASGNLELTAGTAITNLAGRMLAINDVRLDAPEVNAITLDGYTAIGLYRGLAHALGSNQASVLRSDVGGIFTATNGSISISGDTVLDGGQLNAKSGVRIDGKESIIKRPSHESLQLNHLGWLTSVGF